MTATTGATTSPPKLRRIVILVVHGIGEQRRFGTLEEVAGNLVAALRKHPKRQAQVEVLEGDQQTRGATEPSWRDAPVRVSWLQQTGGHRVEATFREVFWADLDLPLSFGRWLRLLVWALTMPGVRIFSLGDGVDGTQEHDPGAHGLLSARQLSGFERAVVRLQLLLICSPLFMLLTLGV